MLDLRRIRSKAKVFVSCPGLWILVVPSGSTLPILFGHDEGMVRREGEQRGEEWFLHFREFFARELQERFVPDAPVTVEIPGAVYRFVILAAQEPLDAGAAGVAPNPIEPRSEPQKKAVR